MAGAGTKNVAPAVMTEFLFPLSREMEFTCAQDYVQLIPYDLPEPFTSAQLAKAVQIRKEQAGIVCNILHDLGVMKREGKKGNAYLYRVVEV